MFIPNTMRSLFMTASVLIGLGLTSSVPAADVNKLVQDCADCHGKDGASTVAEVPIIGGFSATYLGDSLNAYKKNKRPCPEAKYVSGSKKGQTSDMCKVSRDLSDADIKQIAKYYAGKKFVRAQQKFDATLAKKGEKLHERKCEKCHSENATLADDDNGILAGQWIPYLRSSIKEYTSGKRPMDEKMKVKIEKLDSADLEALVQYYGSFKPAGK